MLAATHGHEAVVELLTTVAFHSIKTGKLQSTPQSKKAVASITLDLPTADIAIPSAVDGHSAVSVAQANNRHATAGLLQDSESQNAVASPDLNQPSLGTGPEEDGSDSDSSESYFDAEEGFGEDAV